MLIELEDAPRTTALMRVIGVGGAGGNAVNRMIEEELEGVDFISANTDAQALNTSMANHTIQLGKKLTRGLGAGARPGIGRQAVAEDADDVRAALGRRGPGLHRCRHGWRHGGPGPPRWSAKSRANSVP